MTKVFKGKEIDGRKYKFLLNRLRRIKDPMAVDKVVKTFDQYPQLSDVTSRYLKEFASSRPSIRNAICSFLESPGNIYPWQEMWLLRALFGCNSLTRTQLNFLRGRLEQPAHWANRSLCLLLIGKYGDPTDLDFCWQFFQEDPLTDRAVLLCCQRLPAKKRLQKCNESLTKTPELAGVARMMKGINRFIWPA